MDMDGVLVHEEQAIPGAAQFLAQLRERETPFLVLTNNSIYTRRDLAARLRASGLEVPEESIWTSALATARFLDDQRPGGTAFVIGEAGLTQALYEVGYTMTERDPDYVVIGETRTYSFERITRAIRLLGDGARLIATNPDPTGPSPDGPLPATGAVAALINRATGVQPYFVGKPNPLMMRSALNAIAWTPTSSRDSRRASRRFWCSPASRRWRTSPTTRTRRRGSWTRLPTLPSSWAGRLPFRSPGASALSASRAFIFRERERRRDGAHAALPPSRRAGHPEPAAG
jgi:NagD protein